MLSTSEFSTQEILHGEMKSLEATIQFLTVGKYPSERVHPISYNQFPHYSPRMSSYCT